MKRILLLTLALAVMAGSASAAGIGLRAGLTKDPDQVHVGAHTDMGLILPPMRLVPNVEVGFGDNTTRVCLNGDLIFDFAGSPFGVGGELGLNWADYKGKGSDTDLGLSVLGNYRLGLASGNTLLFEIKFGLMDSPEFKATVGFSI